MQERCESEAMLVKLGLSGLSMAESYLELC